MELTRAERETIILFNEADDDADVFTHNGKLIRKLDKLCSEKPCECLFVQENAAGGRFYSVPKKWVRINATRVMSDDQRAAATARLANARESNLSKKSLSR